MTRDQLYQALDNRHGPSLKIKRLLQSLNIVSKDANFMCQIARGIVCRLISPHILIGTALSLLLLSLAGTAHAVAEMSDAERDMLPDYCRHQSNVSAHHPSPPRSIAWENELGSAFAHIHHYCWAILNIGRSYRSSLSLQERRSILKGAVNDIDYVLLRTPTGMPLLPEIHTTRGRALLLMNELRQAEQSFAEARKIDPTYWRAYFLWAIHLQQSGRIKEASELIQEGLTHSPDSKALTKLATELGNKRPNPGSKVIRVPANKLPEPNAEQAEKTFPSQRE